MAKMSKESENTLDLISDDFVIDASMEKSFLHKRSGDKMGEKGFKHYCAKHYGQVVMEGEDKDGNATEKRLNAAELWGNPDFNIPSRRVVRRVVMEPTLEDEADGDPETFNRWYVLREEMVKPNPKATADDIGPFLQHLMYISDNDTVGVMFFLCWLAQLYQTPGIKLPTAILFYSKFGGVGKTMLWKLLREVFGKSMVGSCSGANLQKSFDDVTENKRILFVNEMAKSDRVDGYEKFKNMISEEQVSFEGKGRAARDQANITHYIVTTNNNDALPLMERDRRVVVLQCLSEPKAPEYYKALGAWMEGEGPAALANVLMHWKFPDTWDAMAPVPQTKATQSMQHEARGGLVELIESLIEEGRAPFDRDIGRPLDIQLQLEALYGTVLRGVRLNHKTLAGALEKLGACNYTIAFITKDGKRTTSRVWVWRNHEEWATRTGQEVADLLSL